MSTIEGFICNNCRANFEDVVTDNPNEVPEITCPKCGSNDVTQSDAAKEFLELVRDMGSTGG